MLATILAKIFGTKNDRIISEYSGVVKRINSFEPAMQAKSDEELKNSTALFRERLKKGETLDELLPEAFATVREVSKRTVGMRHFDVQMMGGIALHRGCVAEMKTGEGKTLTATLALYLNCLAGPAHLVTVNDYLAKRDATWNQPIYDFLGVKVAYLQNMFGDAERKAAYQADILYGTNSEFGFDYLRDNMKFDYQHFVQRDLNYAIVDEVDSILIDEARTPLIISGASERDSKLYKVANEAVKKLSKVDGDFEVDEKAHSAILTEAGIDKVEKFLEISNIYAPENVMMLHHIQQALKAHTLYKRDVNYMISSKKEVLIVDEFTGRALPGRRFSDGLHQAIEAKEGVKIERENQTLASITLQNYFRIYKKLAGMTGTAFSDAVEFHKIYNLSVVVIPTHRPMIRLDEDDEIFLTEQAKYKAVVADIKRSFAKQQPVLVGTASIEASEYLSLLLKKEGIPHSVLNAKQHEKEAEIVKNAGEAGRVTISTSMAGRGTDIKLGAGVSELGGLRVIGTERYENRRIDDQLRGRSGRQGDPGSSKFYISFEDNLMRIFAGANIKDTMTRYGGMKEEESLEHSWASSMVKSNQEKQERHHFDIRKNLLEYDDVMNQQRNVIYSYRRQILRGLDSLDSFVKDMIRDVVADVYDFAKKQADQKSTLFYEKPEVQAVATKPPIEILSELSDLSIDELLSNPENLVLEPKALVQRNMLKKYEELSSSLPKQMRDEAEKWVLLNIIDYAWKNHLQNLDHLREGIGLRGYGQKNPLYEYKRESFEEFVAMIRQIKMDAIRQSFRLKAPNEKELTQEQIDFLEEHKEELEKMIENFETNELVEPATQEELLPAVTEQDQESAASQKNDEE